MAIPSLPTILKNVFAYNGDYESVPETTPTGTATPSIEVGFPSITSVSLKEGGLPPTRKGFNGIFHDIYVHLFRVQSGTPYEWSSQVNYPKGSEIMTSAGVTYRALQDSGPDYTAGAVDPTTDTAGTYWDCLSSDQYSDYVADFESALAR